MNLETIAILISLTISVLGTAFAVYKTFSKPDIDNAQAIALITQRLATLDKVVTNDIPHDIAGFRERIDDVHRDVATLRTGFEVLKTVLEERMPPRRTQ